MTQLNNKSKELLCIWTTAVCFSVVLLIVVSLIFIIVINSVGHFWTPTLQLVELKNGEKILGVIQKETDSLQGVSKVQLKVGNRDFYKFDFRWINKADILQVSTPEQVFILERTEYGDFYGNFFQKNLAKQQIKQDFVLVQSLLVKKEKIAKTIDKLNYSIRKKELQILKKEFNKLKESSAILDLKKEKQNLEEKFKKTRITQDGVMEQLQEFRVVLQEIGGQQKELLIENIVRYYAPNKMNLLAKMFLYIEKFWEFVSSEPREANTEGGILPIIFGTVMLVMIMSIFCYPFGLAAAIYLSEYASNNWITYSVRIAVSNLAGVPSIVYGIFGLSFFIYGVGGFFDKIFYPERLPTPTFGTGGILWASLTLAVLTLPVVIVATEEALNTVPKSLKEGSLALGSTPTQTLWRVSLPIALPGIITGFILAIARAAGEVAPLLITGVVKLAPALPIDGNFPYLHLDRKFMHLGFHIFDIAFQSPNVEVSRSIVFVSTFILLVIVILLCSFAMVLREKMRKKYKYQQI